jgi:hypothetical protein
MISHPSRPIGKIQSACASRRASLPTNKKMLFPHGEGISKAGEKDPPQSFINKAIREK